MSRFSDEVKIIPPVAWVLAAVSWVGMFFLLLLYALPRDKEMRYWSQDGKILFSIWPGMLIAIFVLLIGYINADARRRGMRYVMWTLLAIFVPSHVGIILYFIFRDPLLVHCPKCGAQARTNFAFCPQCGTQMTPACPACKRGVETGWRRCPYCGAGLGATPPPPVVNQQTRG